MLTLICCCVWTGGFYAPLPQLCTSRGRGCHRGFRIYKALRRSQSMGYSEEFIDATWLMSLLASQAFPQRSLVITMLKSGSFIIQGADSRRLAACRLAANQIETFAKAGGRVFSTYDTSLRDDFWRSRPDYGLSGNGSQVFVDRRYRRRSSCPAAKSHPIFHGIKSGVPVARTHGLINKVNPNAIIWPSGQQANRQ